MENQNQNPMNDFPAHEAEKIQLDNPNQSHMNLSSDPVALNPAPQMEKLQAPVAASHLALESDKAFELSKAKKSHVGVLLTVFAVMSGAVGYVAVKSPDLLRASVFMISAESVRPSAPASNIYTKKVWAKTTTPDTMLKSDAGTFNPVGGSATIKPATVDMSGVKVEPNPPEAKVQGNEVKVVPAIVDTDLDGVPDDSDNCPTVSNADQKDANSNKVGDACEVVQIAEEAPVK